MNLPLTNSMILFQDEDLLVINKPANLSVLPDGWNPEAPFLQGMLKAQFPGLMVVHRLDKITSGVMVFALNPDTHRDLNLQFEHHTTRKAYHALCCGTPRWETHTARHRLRINVGHSHRTVVDNGKGIHAETIFTLLERLGTYSLLEAIPATGRTHQIRVHAMALGLPLLGDRLYSAPETDLLDRPALHAASLSFSHKGQELTFQAPYPADLEALIKKLRTGA